MEHYQNFTDTQYQGLLRTLLMTGIKKSSRTGVDCLSVFGANIKINLQDGFPLLTTKRMAWNQIVTELKWFLKGDTNIKYLVENNCHIWNDDAYKKYVRVCDYDLDKPMSKKEFIDLIDEYSGHYAQLVLLKLAQWFFWFVIKVSAGLCELFGRDRPGIKLVVALHHRGCPGSIQSLVACADLSGEIQQCNQYRNCSQYFTQRADCFPIHIRVPCL